MKWKNRKNFKQVIPNLITIMALCAGMTSIRLSLEGKWEWAVIAIIFAAILDVMDGRIARLLDASSHFGAELDSLSDLVCFGVAPSYLVYSFALSSQNKLGWNAVLFYTICMALRLARFNLGIADTGPQWKKNFFVGVPAPAGAFIILTPLILFLGIELEFLRSFALNFFFLLITGFFLISRLPIFSHKAIKIPKKDLYLYIMGFVLISAFLYSHTWIVLGLLNFCFLASIPISYRKYRKLLKENHTAAL